MVELEKIQDLLTWFNWLNSKTREDSETFWSSAMVKLPSIVEVYKRQNIAQFL